VQLAFTNPLFLFALKQQDGISNTLANPRIRVKNKEKARIHIGDRVPVITTTAAATGGFVSESVTYLDVGLKLEVEPLISLEDEVSIKVGLEVSNITNTVKSTSGSLTYQLGTRTAATNLRLRDGETQVLAGLISTDDRRAADRVPGLGDLPIAGRLFSHTLDNNARSEIVLLITPRLARTLARPDAASVEFAAGTESSTGTPRLGAAPPIIPSVPGAALGRGTAGDRRPSGARDPGRTGRGAADGAVRRDQALAAMKLQGFTLIELVITVAIVAVLASVALPLNELIVQRAKESDLRRSLREIREALDAYKQASDDGRVVKRAGESGYPKRLDDLIAGAEDQKDPKKARIYFLRRLPRDPFATDATLAPADTWGKRSYDSPPDDPREGDDVFDVFTRSTVTGINGRPLKEW